VTGPPPRSRARGDSPALVLALAQYTTSILPVAVRELRRWHRRADAIPDPVLRGLARATLAQEHMNSEGAALVSILAPVRRRARLVRLVVAYQTMYDYLDTLGEQPAADPRRCSRGLHATIEAALTPGRTRPDWSATSPQNDGGGYLSTLVATCQRSLALLPSWPAVAAAARASARQSAEVQELNHTPRERPASLRSWSERNRTHAAELTWWEHAGGASSTLDLHILLALAARESADVAEVAPTIHYGTVLCALNTMLESLTDLPSDRRTGEHSYISYYSSPSHTASRLAFLATRAVVLARDLPLSSRHIAILQAMVSMYLARPEARAPGAAQAADALIETLPEALKPLISFQTGLKALRKRAARPSPHRRSRGPAACPTATSTLACEDRTRRADR
jgi:tetraprenyl-beta-curcumene synthase